MVLTTTLTSRPDEVLNPKQQQFCSPQLPVSAAMLVKLVATLTVLVANVVICVCILLLYQLINQVTLHIYLYQQQRHMF